VDEATIRLTGDRRAHAEALLTFSTPQPHLPGVIPFIGRPLSQRIALIVQEIAMSRRHTLAALAIAAAVSGAATTAAVTTFPIGTGTSRPPAVHELGNGVTLPVVVHEVKPRYTPAAMQAKIQGSVWLDLVVGTGGNVIRVDVARSLDSKYGLDREAVAAAWQWGFKPGLKDGTPVPVRITLELTFTLR